MQENQRIEFLGPCENGPKPLVRKLLAIYVRAELDALETELTHHPFELRYGHLGVLHGQSAQPDKAVGMSCRYRGDFVVDDSVRRSARFGRESVVVLERDGRDCLNIDSHLIHVGEPALHAGELFMNRLGLPGVDLSCRRVGEAMQPVGFHIEDVRDRIGGRRNVHVAMQIHGQRPRPRSWSALAARGHGLRRSRATGIKHRKTPDISRV